MVLSQHKAKLNNYSDFSIVKGHYEIVFGVLIQYVVKYFKFSQLGKVREVEGA